MTDLDITSTSIEEQQPTVTKAPVPILMVAHAPMESVAMDRCRLSASFTIGRKVDNDLTIRDHKISGNHLRIFLDGDHFSVEDLKSTNGVYLNGKRITEKRPLPNNAVIRAGNTVLVFHSDGEEYLAPPPIERFGMAGQFHVAPILKQIEEAALSSSNLLIGGPSGSGKELAAKAIAAILAEGGKKIPFIAHNSARFVSEEEATSTLFGVGSRVFSHVNPRPGLIEQAEGGVLFLDEIHNLTRRVQRSLLRVIEDRHYTRIGETATRIANVRFVMASNEKGPTYGMAHDLCARLHHITIPPLTERVADVPSIFDHLLKQELEKYSIPAASVLPCLKGEHYALMCMDGFEADNVRGIKDLITRIVTKIVAKTAAPEAVVSVFAKRFAERPQTETRSTASVPATAAVSNVFVQPPPENPSINAPTEEGAQSTYDKYKDIIIATYKDREENISATMRVLNGRGIPCSRRWLSVYLIKWGVKKSRSDD